VKKKCKGILTISKPDSTTKKEVFFKYAFGKAAGRRFREHIDRRVSQTGGIRPEKVSTL